MKTLSIYLIFVMGVVTACSSDLHVVSPDGTIAVSVQTDKTGQVLYSVTRNNQAVLLPCEMGFTCLTETGDTIQPTHWRILDTEQSNSDTTWETIWGEEQYIRDQHNQLIVHLQHASGLKMDVYFRCFNDGMAFRYKFPESNGPITILDERTTYTFAQEPQIWSIPWRTEYYEAIYERHALQKKDTMCSPITLEMPDGSYAFLHEAALTDFPCQNLYSLPAREGQGGSLATYLTPWMKDDQVINDKAYITTPFATPWRFMVLASTLPDLVASRIMLNLNEPCKIEDTSWIRPMKFIGIWWGMHMRQWTWRMGPQHGATTEHMKSYIDFAADHHIQAVLAEGWNTGWEGYEGVNSDHFSFVTPYEDYDIDFLSQYAQSRGVEILCHHETSGRANEYEQDLDTAYRYMQSMGMHAVKTGYVAPIITTMDGHQLNRSQSGVRHYRRVIETAARYHVMIDNHEPVMPTGLQRTYPNLMTQEGIRGQEWNAWAQDGGSPCSHVCTLPFTRMLAGPADYTPGVFAFENAAVPTTRVHATVCNQLALFVVLYSPLQMACDQIEHYSNHPREFQFISDVPCDWQRSVLLDGRIGEYVIMARQARQSEDWYIGAITDDEARDVQIDLLSLLSPGQYVATIYRDAPNADWRTNPYETQIDTIQLSITKDSAPMPIHLASGGGCAIHISSF